MTSFPSVNGVTRDDLRDAVREAMYEGWSISDDELEAVEHVATDAFAALQRRPEPADEPVEYGLRFFFDQSITAFETRAGALEVVRHWPEHYELMQLRPAGPWVPVAPDGDEDEAR